MRRTELLEIHDHPVFPTLLRNLVTDALQALWRFGDSYRAIVPCLHRCLQASDSNKILDLCSGGGGPWIELAGRFERDHSFPVEVRLSDKYPNSDAFVKAGLHPGVSILGIEHPVDAAHVPANHTGFRTMFSSFHHFSPVAARAVLLDAVEKEQGIAIFEVPRRSFRTIFIVSLTPLLVLLLTPGIAPFRWSRLFWTYIIPVVPLVILIDGLISCFRAYSQEELHEFVAGLAHASSRSKYHWEIGLQQGALLPVTYLIGYPTRLALKETQLSRTANKDQLAS